MCDKVRLPAFVRASDTISSILLIDLLLKYSIIFKCIHWLYYFTCVYERKIFQVSPYLATLVPNSVVELLALQYEEFTVSLEDAALDSDGSCRVHVVACHHSHTDTSSGTPQNGIGHLDYI